MGRGEGGAPLFILLMPGQTQPQIQPQTQSLPQPPAPDAGAEARANDIIDALIQTKAWQDSQRKVDAEEKHYESQTTAGVSSTD